MSRFVVVLALVSCTAPAAGQGVADEDDPIAEAEPAAPPAAEPLVTEVDPAMTNRRLGRLLKKHFPDAAIQGQEGFWQIKLPAPPAEPDKAEANGEAEQGEDEGLVGPGADGHLPPVVLVLTDQRADRMRVMMPIREFDLEEVEDLQLAIIALQANYDRALDARYALQDGVLWSAFIHPLSSLTDKDLASALRQVQSLRDNTGTSYSSGEWLFGPGRIDPEDPLEGRRPGPGYRDPDAV